MASSERAALEQLRVARSVYRKSPGAEQAAALAAAEEAWLTEQARRVDAERSDLADELAALVECMGTMVPTVVAARSAAAATAGALAEAEAAYTALRREVRPDGLAIMDGLDAGAFYTPNRVADVEAAQDRLAKAEAALSAARSAAARAALEAGQAGARWADLDVRRRAVVGRLGELGVPVGVLV